MVVISDMEDLFCEGLGGLHGWVFVWVVYERL